jgi:hypothetical protein
MNIENKKMLNNKMGTKVDINTRLQQTMDILLKRFNGKKIDDLVLVLCSIVVVTPTLVCQIAQQSLIRAQL